MDNNSIKIKLFREKLYYSISEVSEICGVDKHVLRFWETQFPKHLRPKRIGNRRMYTAEEIQMIQKISGLLRNKKMTIKGACMELDSSADCERAQRVYETLDRLRQLRDFLKKISC